MEVAMTSTVRQRRYDIDALRVGAVLVGLLYHSGRAFDTEAWHIKNAVSSQWFDLMGDVLTPWRMPLLMLLAGAGTYFALGFRSGGQYTAERLRRLLVPFIFGMLVIVPPQIYLERIGTWMPNREQPVDFSGSYVDFYPLVFTSGPYPMGGALSWHHLWFVLYLLVFSIVLLPLFVALRRSVGQRVIDWLGDAVSTRWGFAWLGLGVLPLIAIELTLRPRFGNTHALIGDWANVAHLSLVFVYGYLLIANERLGLALERGRRWTAVATALCMLVYLAALNISAPLPWRLALRTLVEWGVMLAALGYGRRLLSRPSRVVGWASEIAYPFYIWHQTVIVVIAFFVVQWDAPMLVKFLAVLLLSLLGTIAGCELARRVAVLRPLFGLKPTRSTHAPAQAHIEARPATAM
jgi:glucans biosynthesis protein C